MTPFSKWKTIGYAVAIFAAGAISGGAIGVYETNSRLFAPVRDEEMALRFGKRLETRLNLTAEQAARVTPIVKSAFHDIHSVRVEDAQRITKVLDDSFAQISAILTPEQRQKLEELKRKQHELMQERFQGQRWHNGPGGPGGPGGPNGFGGMGGFGGPGGGFNHPPRDMMPYGSPKGTGTGAP